MMFTAKKNAAKALYSWRWRSARKTFLHSNPLCKLCAAHGYTTAATVVDHIQPHRGDYALFWDVRNWQALCERCHNSHKQRMERGSGSYGGFATDGTPLDARHFWNAPADAQVGGTVKSFYAHGATAALSLKERQTAVLPAVMGYEQQRQKRTA